jgi:hypothetical protein
MAQRSAGSDQKTLGKESLGHAYAPLCAASVSDTCLAAGASRIRSPGDLSGPRTGCSNTLFHGLLNELVVVF